MCTSTAAAYFLQLKKDDSLEIAAGISLAFSRTVTVTSSLPVFADITAAWAASVARQVGVSGLSQSDGDGKTNLKKLELDFFSNNETILFAFQ